MAIDYSQFGWGDGTMNDDTTFHFNKLGRAEDERLALLSEECAEVIEAVSKIQRHGYESVNPLDPLMGTNRHQLIAEIGHVLATVHLMLQADDLVAGMVTAHANDKLNRLRRWMHHQAEHYYEGPLRVLVE